MNNKANKVKNHPNGSRVMTYKDAKELGYKDGRQAWELGYISRKSDTDKHIVQIARNGELFVSLPSFKSTRYCIRQYLIS